MCSTLAHVGGLAAMELSGDLVATAGLSFRLGTPFPDNIVRVFDVRAALRPLYTCPFSSPCVLAWQPGAPGGRSLLLAASAGGMFSLMAPGNPEAVETYQVCYDTILYALLN